MKGVFFQAPLEFSINIEGETWQQGDTITGNLSITNHEKSDTDYRDYGIFLAYGINKKVKNKSLDGLSFMAEKRIDKCENSPWSFEIKSDSPISDKSGSLYIVCGKKESPFEIGLLQLNIIPIKVISDFIEVFTIFFKFKVKSIKNKKGAVEYKLMPPDTKELGGVEQLNLIARMADDILSLEYNFKLRKLVYDDGDVKAKVIKEVIKQDLEKSQYQSFGNSTNQAGMQDAINQVLDAIKRKITF